MLSRELREAATDQPNKQRLTRDLAGIEFELTHRGFGTRTGMATTPLLIGGLCWWCMCAVMHTATLRVTPGRTKCTKCAPSARQTVHDAHQVQDREFMLSPE